MILVPDGLNRNRDSSVASLLQNDKNKNAILSPSPFTLKVVKNPCPRLRVNSAKNFLISGFLFILIFLPSEYILRNSSGRSLEGPSLSPKTISLIQNSKQNGGTILAISNLRARIKNSMAINSHFSEPV